jgi:hypothetical protein
MIKWPSTCTCCGITPCPDGDLGIWVANDNQQRDDNFELSVNGTFVNDSLGGRANLQLGYNNYSGHLILPAKYAAFTKAQCEFPATLPPTPAMTDFVAGGLHTRLIFSPNMPVVAGNTLYSIFLKNIQNNHNGNLGTIYLFQVCADPTDGHPIMKFIIGNGTYSGYSGVDLSFSFTTTDCNLCDPQPACPFGAYGYPVDWWAGSSQTFECAKTTEDIWVDLHYTNSGGDPDSATTEIIAYGPDIGDVYVYSGFGMPEGMGFWMPAGTIRLRFSGYLVCMPGVEACWAELLLTCGTP